MEVTETAATSQDSLTGPGSAPRRAHIYLELGEEWINEGKSSELEQMFRIPIQVHEN